MHVLRVTLILLFHIFVCNTSSHLKNDRDGSPNNGETYVRRARRIALNEYLVPPPPPRPHSIRAGRVANPSQKDTPGYFSQLMNWLNPFSFGSPTSQKSHLETPYVSHPQPYAPPPFHQPSAPQPDPSFHPLLGSQATLPLYPPLAPPPAQHSGPLLTTPFSAHPVPPLSPPPNPQIYNVPPAPLHNVQHVPPPGRSIDGPYVPVNKGKPCNPCNKIPWIPMQGGGHHSEQYLVPPQLSDGYLPPGNQPSSHDIQYAASDEIRVPVFSQIPVEQSRQQPLYPGLMPFYKAEPSDRPTLSNAPYVDNLKQFESPPAPVTPTPNHEERNPQVNTDQSYNLYGNEDLTSSGTQVNQGHVSGVSQNREVEISKEHLDHEGSFGGPIFDSEPADQKYRNSPSTPKQENNRDLSHSVQHKQNTVVNFESPNIENHDFSSQNSNDYYDSFKSNLDHNAGLNHLTPDSNPSASFGNSDFNNHQIGNSNYQYSGDLSPSGSVNKDSQVTTQLSLVTGSSVREGLIHFEESPLLDLTKKGESRTDTQWSTSTVGYTDIYGVSDSTIKTTTDYNLGTDSIFDEDTSSFVKTTESYSSSDIRNINSVFGTSAYAVVNLPENNRNQQVETSTINAQYTNQPNVLHNPLYGQQGFLWSNLLPNAPNSRNDSLKNHVSLNHLAQWNDSSPEDSRKQDSQYSKDTKDTVQKQLSIKRNKQVQVIIPYTSEYTPIPFQHSYGDWSVKTNFERTQPRKVSPLHEVNIDNYLQQESRNDIRVVNQSQINSNDSNNLNVQVVKTNNSIDVRRLQKNIDNWTIQEYSKPTTSSTILPSSLHPYLLPSKKIPTEYLTTTEPANYANESKDHHESVKTYSLAGFTFNEVEHEGSTSYNIEKIQPDTTIRIDGSKATASGSGMKEKSTWETYSVSILPGNKERVYVVTPQPVPEKSSKNDLKKREREWERENSQKRSESTINDANNNKSNLSEFEAIEKAYQVLPQAVNNLAVASTGKENIPLWGIMEHEQFASLNLDETDETASEDIVDRPVLYSGHSKVSRAKR
ncbi:PREDICTED: uncharacterized protein LOC108574541 [Habropoda laboriosa]|uniref:uncharacterized protein LOC108574541 n=1 Tax=Habropoda laboriosa TaxID=597456 RepID=UPI00083CD5E4|nr:PREDICTED: uncharacterized protein LOC108574541 [Habropoda laboriosa]